MENYNDYLIDIVVDGIVRHLVRADGFGSLTDTNGGDAVGSVVMWLVDAVNHCPVGCINGVPHVFSGKVYEPFYSRDFSDIAYRILKKMNVGMRLYSRLRLFALTIHSAVMSKQLIADKQIVVFQNLIYNISTQQIAKFSPTFVQTHSLPFAYDAITPLCLWTMYLNQIMPNKACQAVLQEFLGNLFCNRSAQLGKEALFIRSASEQALRSLAEIMRKLFGNAMCSLPSAPSAENAKNVNGKLVNCVASYCASTAFAESYITGKSKYNQHFNNMPRLVLLCRSFPTIEPATEHLLAEHLIVLPLADKVRLRGNFADELASERPAIFRWMMAGRERYIANGGYTECAVAARELEAYLRSTCLPLQFMAEMGWRCDNGAVAEHQPLLMPLSAIYKRYHDWSKGNNYLIDSQIIFSKHLLAAGYRRKRTRNGVGYWIYSNKLKMC